VASGVRHIARDKCNFPGNLQPNLIELTASTRSKYPHLTIPVGNFDSYFPSPSTGKSTTPTVMDICHIYTLGVSSNISRGRIEEAMDTNLLEVAGSSETARTLATCNHHYSIRTTILRLLEYCCLNATWDWHQGFTQTTTKGDDNNYHKVKLQISPRETHWQTLLCSLVYTAISFLCTLSSYFCTFPCNVNRLDPVLNVPE